MVTLYNKTTGKRTKVWPVRRIREYTTRQIWWKPWTWVKKVNYKRDEHLVICIPKGFQRTGETVVANYEVTFD